MNFIAKICSIIFVFSLFYNFACASKTDSTYKSYFLPENPFKNEKAWASIPEQSGFKIMGSKIYSLKQSSFKLAYNEDSIFIEIKCDEPSPGTLNTTANKLWNSDCVEIFISPPTYKDYCQFVINSKGDKWAGWRKDKKRKTGEWNAIAKIDIKEQAWILKIEIPFDFFNKKPQTGDIWKFNIGRDIVSNRDNRYSTWSFLNVSFQEPESFGALKFCGKPPCHDDLAKEQLFINDRYRKTIISEIEKKIKTLSGYYNKFLKDNQKMRLELNKAKEKQANIANLNVKELKSLNKELNNCLINADNEMHEVYSKKLIK
jgi:hypothetical protein